MWFRIFLLPLHLIPFLACHSLALLQVILGWITFALSGWFCLGVAVLLTELLAPLLDRVRVEGSYLLSDLLAVLVWTSAGAVVQCPIHQIEPLLHHKSLWREVFVFLRDWLCYTEGQHDRRPGAVFYGIFSLDHTLHSVSGGFLVRHRV